MDLYCTGGRFEVMELLARDLKVDSNRIQVGINEMPLFDHAAGPRRNGKSLVRSYRAYVSLGLFAEATVRRFAECSEPPRQIALRRTDRVSSATSRRFHREIGRYGPFPGRSRGCSPD